jgi:hypothetical protein
MYLMITFYHKPSVMVVSVNFSLRIDIICFIFGWKIYSLSCVQHCIYQQNFSTVVIKNIFRDINFTVKTFKSSYKVIYWLQCLFLKTYSNPSWVEWNNLCLQVCVINFLAVGYAINHLQRFKSSGLFGCFTVYCYQFTWHSNLVDLNIHQNCCDNLKFGTIRPVSASCNRFCQIWRNSKEDFVQ